MAHTTRTTTLESGDTLQPDYNIRTDSSSQDKNGEADPVVIMHPMLDDLPDGWGMLAHWGLA